MKFSGRDRYFKFGKRGFTLVEILLAILIFTMVSGSLYGSIRVGLKSLKRVKANFEVFQELRICLKYLQQDLRSIFYEASLETEVFSADSTSFSVICYKVGGLYKITHSYTKDGLFRSVSKVVFNQDENENDKKEIAFSKVNTYQLSTLIKTVGFEFLDTDDNWRDKWDIAEQWPKAVRIVFLFAYDDGRDCEFQSIISIPIGRKTSISKKWGMNLLPEKLQYGLSLISSCLLRCLG